MKSNVKRNDRVIRVDAETYRKVAYVASKYELSMAQAVSAIVSKVVTLNQLPQKPENWKEAWGLK